jgi:hypothetical protein
MNRRWGSVAGWSVAVELKKTLRRGKLTTVAISQMLCMTHHSTAPTTMYASSRPAGPAEAYAEPVPMKSPVPIPLQKPIMVTW